MIIPVYKPAGMTSHDVAAKIKHAFPGKLKIGHTGTLDPMCTGVLVMLTGNDTKLSGLLPSGKEYRAVMLLGTATDTQDITGHITEKAEAKVSEEKVKTVILSFIGEYEQTPPMYSAIKKDGVPLYKMARQGKTAEIEPRRITIYSVSDIRRLTDIEYSFVVSCSSGTYIRTLCVDIGKKLACPCCMKALERTAANGFVSGDCVGLDDALRLTAGNRLEEAAVPYEKVFGKLGNVVIPEDGLIYFLNGGRLALKRCGIENPDAELLAARNIAGEFIALAGVSDDEIYCKWKKTAQKED